MLEQLVEHLITSFDFGYCLIINILTYMIIKAINKTITKWQKRLILLGSIIVIGTIYYLIGADSRVLINSSILAPVSWSWIFKPLAVYFKMDYMKNDGNEENQ